MPPVAAIADCANYAIDLRGQIRSWNLGAQRITGYTTGDVLGKSFAILFAPEDRERDKPGRALDVARRTGRFEDEGWRVRKDGERYWASGVLEAIRDERGRVTGLVEIVRDTTDRHKAQQVFEEARERLFQSQKLEAVGQLTGGVAHDYNNLLAAILSGLSLAERLAGDNTKLLELLATIRHAAQRGQNLTQQLLTFANRQAMRPEVVSVPKRLNDLFVMLERLFGRQIRIAVNAPATTWPVEVDAEQLDLALLNICLNARDAMPDGGRLVISARNEPAAESAAGDEAGHVVITITDSGPGIPDDVKARVFEPFFTTKHSGKASGLGLSQAYGFAKQAGGSIDIESTPGQGTTVTIRLPAKPADSDAWQGFVSPEAAPKGGGVILLVEDDIAVAEVTAALFEHAGYAVKVVHSAAAALEALKHGIQVDALFSDVVMPGGMNGVQLACTVQSEYPGIPVLLTTGFSGAAEVAQVRGIRVIAKPYDPEEVTNSLAKLIAEARRNAAGTVH